MGLSEAVAGLMRNPKFRRAFLRAESLCWTTALSSDELGDVDGKPLDGAMLFCLLPLGAKP